jgi:hypothetical protein
MIGRGVFKVGGPELFRKYSEAVQKGQPLPDLSQSTGYSTMILILATGFFIFSAWSMWTWDVYREQNELPKGGRNTVALIFSGILSWPIAYIITFAALGEGIEVQ